MTHATARAILAKLPPLEDLLRGSLLQRRTFHPSGVACSTCASGKGHRQWVLNVNYPGGKTRQITLHPDQLPRCAARSPISIACAASWNKSASAINSACSPSESADGAPHDPDPPRTVG